MVGVVKDVETDSTGSQAIRETKYKLQPSRLHTEQCCKRAQKPYGDQRRLAQQPRVAGRSISRKGRTHTSAHRLQEFTRAIKHDAVRSIFERIGHLVRPPDSTAFAPRRLVCA